MPNPRVTKLGAILGVTAAVFLLDWFYVIYITSHGFTLKTHEFAFGALNVTIPLQWLPVIGVVLVSFVAWYEVSSTIFPRRTGPELDPLANIRLMRVIAVSLAVFVCVLYIPYVIGSSWFWSKMSSGSSISPIRDLALALLNTDQSVMGMDPLWQYSASQVLALMAMVFSAWAFGRGARRMRR